MNILFLTLKQIENINESGIYLDLLLKLRESGHNISVVTPREKRNNLNIQCEKHVNFNILKVKIGNITKTNIVEKGISTLKIEKQFIKAIRRYFGEIKFDLVLYSTPPITFDKVVKFVKKRDNAKSYLMLKDIFPQNAVDIKIFSKRNPIYYYFRKKEKSLYKNADIIGCMSNENVKYVIKNNKYLSSSKIEICPNTITPINYETSLDEKNKIKRKYEIPLDKTIFLYGGNLGKPQGVQFIIQAIKRNERNKNAFILVVGSGTEYRKLDRFFSDIKPKNARLVNQLPTKDYEILANSCDVGLIFLDNRFTIPNFPSRLLSYMQASMPVLAATDPNTDIGNVIEENSFGYWCESKGVDKFNDLVNRLCDQKLRDSLGQNARKYLENNYTSKHAYEIIMKHFK